MTKDGFEDCCTHCGCGPLSLDGHDDTCSMGCNDEETP